MATTAIDTLRYARRLKAAGVPDAQAEEMADALGSELVENLATKANLDAAVSKLQGTMLLLKWMVGFNLGFSCAVLWLLLTMR